MRIQSLIMSALALAGCVAGPDYKPLASEKADASYEKLTLTFGTGPAQAASSNSTNAVRIYMKFYENNRNLAICGFWVGADGFTATDKQLFPQWLAGAVIYSGGAPIAPAKFMYERTPKFNEYDAQATCIETAVPYARFMRSAPLAIRGDTVRTWM